MRRLRVALSATVLTATAVVPLAGGLPGPLTGSLSAPAAAVGCPASGGLSVPNVATAASGNIVLQGHGWGHGLGMSQYGAQGAARLGCGHDVILRTYYAGTHLLARALPAPVLLNLATAASRSTVTAETGAVTWSTRAGVKVVQPAAQTWTVLRRAAGTAAGVALVDATGVQRLWAGVGDRLTLLHETQVVRVRSFTGASTVAGSDLRVRWDQTLFDVGPAATVVRQFLATDGHGTAVQKYLWGLGEVPVTWPQEALRAQADAARTYLVQSYRAAAGAYVIGVTDAAQVYRGATHEDQDAGYGGGWRHAVDGTAGELVVDAANVPVWTMYTSSHGGWSESRAYVYGSQGGIGYLRAVDDSRWDLASDDPNRSWAVSFTPAQLAARLGFSSVSAVAIAGRGTPGRALGLRVTGVRAGVRVSVALTGGQARYRLGLLSPGFTVAWTPQPPTAGGTSPGPLRTLVGDWDGDGRDDVGTWRDGLARLRLGNGTVLQFVYGTRGAIPVVGDWDGDGRDSLGVYWAGRWYLRNSLTAGVAEIVVNYGSPADVPVVGRWPGMTTGVGLGVVRGNQWYLRRSLTPGVPDLSGPIGRIGDTPLVGDWDGDGTDTPGVAKNGVFYLADALVPVHVTRVPFGYAPDLPVVGNWDGLAGDTPGVLRVSSSTWFWRNDFRGGVGTGSVVLGG